MLCVRTTTPRLDGVAARRQRLPGARVIFVALLRHAWTVPPHAGDTRSFSSMPPVASPNWSLPIIGIRFALCPSAAALRTHPRTSSATKDLATARPASPQFLLPLWWCAARRTCRRGVRCERKKRGSGSACLYHVYFILSVRLEHL
ncbi:hypothetical protein ACQJBY_065762 [Aegilops geniculata]